MARKDSSIKEYVKPKNPTQYKVNVTQGRSLSKPYIPFKELYTEKVLGKEMAEKRRKELEEEYKNYDAVSVFYYSI